LFSFYKGLTSFNQNIPPLAIVNIYDMINHIKSYEGSMEKTPRMPHTRMIVATPTEIFKDIKKRAVDRGMTLKGWVLQAIIEKIVREDKVK
jgi:hypothetical protein